MNKSLCNQDPLTLITGDEILSNISALQDRAKFYLWWKISVFHNTNCYKHKVLNRFIAKFWQGCLHEWNDSKKECIKVDKTMDIDIEWDVTF